MVHFHLRGVYTLLVCGGEGDFSQYRLNVKSAHAIFFLSNSVLTYLWSYLYTLSCIHALFEYGFCVVKKNRYVKIFFYNSCGTLIWVRIIPVKIESGLTGIIRTYIIIGALLYFSSLCHLLSMPVMASNIT